jgi:hypothetical protein
MFDYKVLMNLIISSIERIVSTFSLNKSSRSTSINADAIISFESLAASSTRSIFSDDSSSAGLLKESNVRLTPVSTK